MELEYYKRYCKDIENVENYEKAKTDNFKGWECHHRLETHTSDGERRVVDVTAAELQALGMYYHRPASELIFLTESEHKSLRKVSAETREKQSIAAKGKNNPMYGKYHTEDAKKKMRYSWDYDKHFTAETRKKLSEARKGNTNTKGMHWFNNGKINKLCYECPDGFVPGMLK